MSVLTVGMLQCDTCKNYQILPKYSEHLKIDRIGWTRDYDGRKITHICPKCNGHNPNYWNTYPVGSRMNARAEG